MEFTHIVDGKELRVVCDKDDILSEIESQRKKYEPQTYLAYYNDFDDPYLTKEEYEENLDAVVSKLEEMLDSKELIGYLEEAKKKKNKFLHNGRIVYRYGCNNTIFFQEWHNSWKYHELVVKAVDDTTLRISYVQTVDTPA